MTNYIRSLDGIRALAVALVMLFHFQLFDAGWIGVQIFFVLSGFLITRILLHEKNQSLDFYLKRFYWRRAVRIFPLYFTYLLLVSLVFLFVSMPESTTSMLPYLWTYTFNFTRLSADWTHSPLFTHFWSLSVEEQFYLVWPLLVFVLSEKWLKRMLLLIIAAGPIARYLLGEWLIGGSLSDEAAGEAIYWSTLSHFDAFAMGGAITLFRLPERIMYPGRLLIAATSFTILVGGLNWYLLEMQGAEQNLHNFGYGVGVIQNYQHVWSYTLLNFCFAAFIISLITSNSLSKFYPLRLFEHPVMVAIGRVSYGMYVFHWAIMAVFIKVMAPITGKGWLSFVLYFCLVWLVSWLSFQQYESRFLRLKDRLFSTKRAKQATKGKAEVVPL
ncbi:acyltransferase [Cesiribacter sp. SM1]|uniref:acyltransferase family protein n=1 Tax=Cesiribacter sp. SM1 TaxID=2861196 RepID=UPI001CD4C7D9|nr:acyltransferase [Cesiribacter sp. SM1]